jgi:prepilin-type processing-associated H-X9-DG protein
MLVYVGGRYTVTRQATVDKHVPCEQCGTLYGFRVTRQATGTGRSPYYTDNAGAQRRARERAEANLAAAVANTIDVIPCPKCGCFQANMVGVLRRRKHAWMFPVGLLLSIIGAAALFICLAGGRPNAAAIALTAALLLGGVALLIVKPLLQSKFDPNADGASRAGRPAPGVFVIPNAQIAPRGNSTAGPGRTSKGPGLTGEPMQKETPVWYHLKDDQQLGPMTESAMRDRAVRGEMLATDFVWKEGLADWVEASKVKAFFTGGRPTPTRAAVPPPLPPMLPPPLPPQPMPMPAAPPSGGMPVWGWALIGVCGLMVFALVVLFVRRTMEESHRVRCARNMHQIGFALANYATLHGGTYPADAGDLLANSTLDARDFVCPSGDETPAPGTTPQQQAANLSGSHLSYVYVAGAQNAGTPSESTIVLYEKLDAHSGAGINVLFGDGHVEFVPIPRAQQLIQQAQAASAAPPIPIAAGPSSPPPAPSAPASTNLTAPVPGPGTLNHSPGFPGAPIKGVRTALVGGTGGSPYVSSSLRGENVLGFRYEMGTWAGQSIVHTLEPIHNIRFATPHSPRLQVILARDGYIVGGLIVDGKNYANAIRIIFIRWDGQKTDPTDTYLSNWLGTPVDLEPTQLAGHGERVIGIYGRRGLNFDALGLVVQP